MMLSNGYVEESWLYRCLLRMFKRLGRKKRKHLEKSLVSRPRLPKLKVKGKLTVKHKEEK